MTRKFIFHIGPAKTGTSSLQETLFAKRALLIEHGYYYPQTGRHRMMPSLPGHHGIHGELTRNKTVPADLMNELARVDPDLTVVLSSENLSYLTLDAVRTLIDALGPAECEVIYYARRWDHLLPSVWQELIKHGQSHDYLEFLNRQLSAPRSNQNLNYKLPLDRWVEVVGSAPIQVVSYNRMQDQGLGIVAHFFDQILGIDLSMQDEPRENIRNTPVLTETLRMLNRLAFGTKTPTPRVRTEFMRLRANFEGPLAEIDAMLTPYISRAAVCSPLLFNQLEKEFLSSYQAHVINMNGSNRLFGDSAFDTTEYVRSHYLFETKAVDLYRSILGKLDIKVTAPAGSDVQSIPQMPAQQQQANQK